MIKLKAQTQLDKGAVKRPVKRANVKTLQHAAALVRIIAKRSIRRAGKKAKAGRPGKPPRSRTRRLPNAIVYEVHPQKDQAFIGPSHKLISTVGGAHEHGGVFRGRHYPARPYMGPALEEVRPRLPKIWAGKLRQAS